MGIITEDMRAVVNGQRLGFIATVCPDGTPNLSPKGTTLVWDEVSQRWDTYYRSLREGRGGNHPSGEINSIP